MNNCSDIIELLLYIKSIINEAWNTKIRVVRLLSSWMQWRILTCKSGRQKILRKAQY